MWERPPGIKPGWIAPDHMKIRKEDRAHGLRFQGKRDEEGKEKGEGFLTREEARKMVDRVGEGPYKLDLGCGETCQEGFVGIDNSEVVNPHLLLDLEVDPLPFDDNSIDEIYCHHFLEHITNLIPLMNECQRVLKPGAAMYIYVPLYPSIECFQDPTHVRFFTVRTFEYFHKTNDYWQKTGRTYGILPFARLMQNPNSGIELAVILRK